MVRSRRGPTGGFSLVVAPNELTIASVVAPFDDQARTKICLMQNRPCDLQAPCSAHVPWVQIAEQKVAAFNTTTIADLLLGGAAGDQQLTEGRQLAVGA